MGTHERHRGDQRLLVTALSSCMSTGSLLLSKLRKSYRKWRKLMRYSSFMATKTRIISKVKSFFRSVFLKGHRGRFICQDKGEKRPTYIVGEPVSTSTIVVSGESTADLKVSDKEPLIPQASTQGINAVSGESTADLKLANKKPLIPQEKTQGINAVSGESTADLKLSDKRQLIPREKPPGIDAVSRESTADLKVSDKKPLIPQEKAQGIDAVSRESTVDLKLADKKPLIPQEKAQGIDAVSRESTADLKVADKGPLIPQEKAQGIVALKPFHAVKSPPAQKKKRHSHKRRRHVKNSPRQAAKGDISLLNVEPMDVEMADPFEGVVKASGDTSSVNLKRQALASIDNQPGIFPPPKRAALDYTPDVSTEDPWSSMMETEEVDLPYSWIHNVNHLTEEHLITLTSTGYRGMLDDDIISTALEILQSQFDNFDGLQPPAALLVPGYSVDKKAVQIHYDVERSHWLTTCYHDGKILVADSISDRHLSPSIQQQICNMYSTVVPEPLRHLTFLNVDQQRNFYDCGVFAIAFAVEFLTTNGEPTARFQHEIMRDHLISCLQMGKISGFPRNAIG